MSVRFITNIIEEWVTQKKTGSIEINFREGRIRNYNTKESHLVPKDAARPGVLSRRRVSGDGDDTGTQRRL